MSEIASMAQKYQQLIRSRIKPNTASFTIAALKQALHTQLKLLTSTYHTTQGPRYRLCMQLEETVAHLGNGCSKLLGTDYTVASIVYKVISAEYDLEHNKEWWLELEVLENKRRNMLCDFAV